MSLVGKDKTASSTLVGVDKTSTALSSFKKAGTAWKYDQADILYDDNFDDQGRAVLYDALGTAPSLIGLDKHPA